MPPADHPAFYCSSPLTINVTRAPMAALGFWLVGLPLSVFLGFMALISVNLAVLNLLPIPVLDGGQVLFLLAEAVLRRPLSVKARERLTFVGLVLIGLGCLLLTRVGGDGGKFQDVSGKAGIADPTSKSLGIAILDYDGDTWPDLFVANDTVQNFLFVNRGSLLFGYAFLWTVAPNWPPPAYLEPGRLGPALALGGAVLALAGIRMAIRALRRSAAPYGTRQLTVS